MDDLLQTMTGCVHGRGEVLAVAAGVSSAVERVGRCLSAVELGRGFHGANASPATVADRVEALAAWSPRALADVAAQWIAPLEIRGDDWWTAAWSSSLRHLAALGRIDRERASVPELSREADVVWCDTRTPVTWRATRELAAATFDSYRVVRMKASAPLVDERITADDLEQSPLSLLRLLRGRADRLDAGARALVDEWLPDATSRHPLEAALLAETGRALSLVGVTALAEALAARIAEDPLEWNGVAFSLVTDWRVP